MALEQWDEDVDNGCMSETVILAIVTAASAICVAWIGAYDRRAIYRRDTVVRELVADQLLKQGAHPA